MCLIESIDRLSYVSDAITQVVRALKGSVPLIGFAGSPWTVATYCVEGASTKHFAEIKRLVYSAPDVMHKFLHDLTELTINYLNMQIDAGVSAVMLFDSWGGVLACDEYLAFSLKYLRRIVNQVKLKREFCNKDIPIVLFTKGGGNWLELIAGTGCDAVGIDSSIDISVAKKRIGRLVALQGNLDPFALYAPKQMIRKKAQKIIHDFDSNVGHVFNLGHGIDKNTPIDHVEALVDAVTSITF